MKQIVECVPNFSEGRDQAVLDQIARTIKSVDGIQLLDVDPGADTNRTVFTFIGEPDSVVEAAFQAIQSAAQLIDMRKHTGTHPRMGATDVCPFIPVSNITIEECVELSHRLAKRVGEELEIPVYLYEYAATTPERTNLATVRKGEYEGLEDKLNDPDWKPDYGPAHFNEKSGATVIGVREFLIAYNVTLNTREKKYAVDIALELREKGRPKRTGNISPFYTNGTQVKHEPGKYHCGTCEEVCDTPDRLAAHCQDEHGYDLAEILKEHDMTLDNLDGKAAIKPGTFTHCKAIGWFVDEYDRTQISINLTNYKITPPHLVLEETRRLAAERGLVVTGSEIVGLIPFEALYQAGLYYLQKQDKAGGLPIDDVLKVAVYSMGLEDVSPFPLEEKVLGYPSLRDRTLVQMKTSDLVDEISRDTPAPGGGSVSALASAMGAGLASMVSGLTISKKGYESVREDMAETGQRAQKLKRALLEGVDDDTDAFNSYFEALRLPRKTKEEKERRAAAMQDGLKLAIDVPLKTAKNSLEVIRACAVVAEKGNKNSVTDGGVGAEMAYAGLRGAVLNVKINLPGIKDDAYVTDMKQACEELIREGTELMAEIRKQVDTTIDNL